MDNQQNKSRKISQLNAIQTISTLADKKNVWVPAAKYDIVGNSYSNVAISLEAITSYVNSYLFHIYLILLKTQMKLLIFLIQ